MATYAIGDVQGYSDALLRLVAAFAFDPQRDHLWFVGDLVNRGPDSLGVLRWVRERDEHVTCVLGNHDLRLLACAEGLRSPRRRDTFGDVLDAHDRDGLLDWLRHRPVVHREGEYVLVHAGVPPGWTADDAEAFARSSETALRDVTARSILARSAEKTPRPPHPGATGRDASGDALCVMTHVRTLAPDGTVAFDHKGPPADAPPDHRPWYDLRPADEPITYVTGHWGALGLRLTPRHLGLDSGVAWGGPLTAVRLEDRRVFQSA